MFLSQLPRFTRQKQFNKATFWSNKVTCVWTLIISTNNAKVTSRRCMVTSPIIRKVKTDTLVIIEQVNAVVRVIIEQIYAVVLVIIE